MKDGLRKVIQDQLTITRARCRTGGLNGKGKHKPLSQRAAERAEINTYLDRIGDRHTPR